MSSSEKTANFEINKIYLEKHLRDNSTILKYTFIGIFVTLLAHYSGNIDSLVAITMESLIIILGVVLFLINRKHLNSIQKSME